VTLKCTGQDVSISSPSPFHVGSQDSGEFTLNTSRVTKLENVLIYATWINGKQESSSSTTLTVGIAPAMTIALDTSTPSTTDKVALSGAVVFSAPPVEGKFLLLCSDPDVCIRPKFNINHWSANYPFSIDTSKVSKSESVVIYASWYRQGVIVATTSSNLSITPAPEVSGVTLSTTTGSGVCSIGGVVQLTAPAPEKGQYVDIKCNDGNAQITTFDGTCSQGTVRVRIEPGRDTSDPFTITPSPEQRSTGLIVTATTCSDEVMLSKIASVTVAPAAKLSVIIPANTHIEISAPAGGVSSASAKEGDEVVFTVAQDVVVGSVDSARLPGVDNPAVIIIPKLSPVICRVIKVDHAHFAFINGYLELEVESVEAADGTLLDVEAAPIPAHSVSPPTLEIVHPIIENFELPSPNIRVSRQSAALYPSGAQAEIFHWAPNAHTSTITLPFANTFDDFMKSAAISPGAISIVEPNYGSSPTGDGVCLPGAAAAWVLDSKVRRYDISHWLIGNEMYDNQEYGSVEKDLHAATAYGQNVSFYASTMKIADPTAKVGVVLSEPEQWPDGTQSDWDSHVLENCGTSIDFVVISRHLEEATIGPNQPLLSGLGSQKELMVSATQALIAKYCGANAPNVQIFIVDTSSRVEPDHHAVIFGRVYDPAVKSAVFSLIAGYTADAITDKSHSVSTDALAIGTAINSGSSFATIYIGSDATVPASTTYEVKTTGPSTVYVANPLLGL